MRESIYSTYVKRLLDIIVALLAVVIFSPVLILVSLIVRFKLGNPVIFKQKRPGQDEKIFTMYKFRTMNDAKDSNGNLLEDELRLTKFGKLLRSTSIDELPGIFNILVGDMSFVGPRPLLVSYLPLYSEKQRLRHLVRPGLTGLAQTNGRNLLSWEERFELDLQYIERITFYKDTKIALSTIGKVLNRDGITSDTSETMEPFRGSN